MTGKTIAYRAENANPAAACHLDRTVVVLRTLDLDQTDTHGKLIVISFFAFIFICLDQIREVLSPLDPTSPGHSSPCFMDTLTNHTP